MGGGRENSCVKCGCVLDGVECLGCDRCSGWECWKCAGFTEEDVRWLGRGRARVSLSFSCSCCLDRRGGRGCGSGCGPRRPAIRGLQEVAVDAAGLKVVQMEDVQRVVSRELEIKVEELRQREKRKRNVIVFGLREETGTAFQIRKADVDMMNEMFRYLKVGPMRIDGMSRVGRRSASFRPLLVSLGSVHERHVLLSRTRWLSESELWCAVFVRADMSPSVRKRAVCLRSGPAAPSASAVSGSAAVSVSSFCPGSCPALSAASPVSDSAAVSVSLQVGAPELAAGLVPGGGAASCSLPYAVVGAVAVESAGVEARGMDSTAVSRSGRYDLRVRSSHQSSGGSVAKKL